MNGNIYYISWFYEVIGRVVDDSGKIVLFRYSFIFFFSVIFLVFLFVYWDRVFIYSFFSISEDLYNKAVNFVVRILWIGFFICLWFRYGIVCFFIGYCGMSVSFVSGRVGYFLFEG